MMIILDMPVATTTLVTTMVIMVVSDISIVVVGGMFVRQRVSARLLRSRRIRRALWPKGVGGYFGNSTGHVQETNGRVAESKRIAVGWLKMAVEAQAAVVPVDIVFWRLMTPKSYFAVGHGANALTLVDFSRIYLVP
jgi:hypothetical protein